MTKSRSCLTLAFVSECSCSAPSTLLVAPTFTCTNRSLATTYCCIFVHYTLLHLRSLYTVAPSFTTHYCVFVHYTLLHLPSLYTVAPSFNIHCCTFVHTHYCTFLHYTVASSFTTHCCIFLHRTHCCIFLHYTLLHIPSLHTVASSFTTHCCIFLHYTLLHLRCTRSPPHKSHTARNTRWAKGAVQHRGNSSFFHLIPRSKRSVPAILPCFNSAPSSPRGVHWVQTGWESLSTSLWHRQVVDFAAGGRCVGSIAGIMVLWAW